MPTHALGGVARHLYQSMVADWLQIAFRLASCRLVHAQVGVMLLGATFCFGGVPVCVCSRARTCRVSCGSALLVRCCELFFLAGSGSGWHKCRVAGASKWQLAASAADRV